MTIRVAFAAVAALGALATTSCSSGTSSASCVVGRTVECACTSGAMGAQTCTAGGVFSPCSCTEGSAPTAKTDAPDLSCNVLTDHVVRVVADEARRNGDTISSDEVAATRAFLLEWCRDGDWPIATRQCVNDASNGAGLETCLEGAEGGKKMSKSKTTEAREFVKKLYDGARAYYMDPNYSRNSITPIPPQFPEPSVGPTPPLDSCCAQGGKCEPNAMIWDHDTWVALQFSVDDPHYYSYTYITPDPFTEFTVRANGDLDCDGEYSTFEMWGVIDSIYSDGPAGSAALARVNELE